jgi:trans-2,3-dihydro-3-hydroxyanthranilate isomerase
MDKPIFYILDVFAQEKFSGNQLAVFRSVKMLSDQQMQKIAKEMNFSETTFILSEGTKDTEYNVRIFTPEIEVPFAGHPTLGTAFVIQHEILKKPVKEITLKLKAGKIPISFVYTSDNTCTLWMKQLQPIFGDNYNAKSISEILNLNVDDINSTFPIQEVSTGLPVIIVPLKTLDAVKRTKINKDKYFDFIKKIKTKTILVFCPETYHITHDLNVRFFADQYGIPEDPATGSANGCLAAYLVKHRFFGKKGINLQVEQGYEIGRFALLYLKAEERENEIDIYVGGKVKFIAKGKFV